MQKTDTQSGTPPISVVIPTFNRLKTLRQVIGSYLDQPHVGEIIIVDDGGTDGTQAFIEEITLGDPRVTYVRNDTRSGAPATRNLGVRHASGRFIVFGEDDLRFGPEYAARLMECLETSGASLAAGRIIYPLPGESDEDAIARLSVPPADRLDRRRLSFDASAPAPGPIEVPFIHAITMVRREVFDAVLYDPGYRGNAYREETDFCLRAGEAGHRIMFCPRAYCVHLPREVVQLGGQMSRGIWIYKYWSLRNNYRFLRRHYAGLRRRGVVTDPMLVLLLSFAFAEMRKIPSFYLRRYSPGLYAALARKLGK